MPKEKEPRRFNGLSEKDKIFVESPERLAGIEEYYKKLKAEFQRETKTHLVNTPKSPLF